MEKLTIHINLDTLMRQDTPTIHIHLVSDTHIVPQHTHVLQPRPFPHCAVPAHNRTLHPRVVFHFAPAQQHAALYPHPVANHHVRPDRHVGADAAVLAHLRGGVDQHVAAIHVGRAGRGEFGGALLRQGREVEACSRQEVLGLADVHPVAVQVEGVQLAVGADGGEGLLLDAGGSQLDARQHGGVEDVDARVDAVADELDGFLDEALDARRVAGAVHHDAVLRGLFDLGDDDGALLTVRLVEGGERGEGVVADDVAV